jgi:F-type H+-transporting ATPase subunit alpha
MRSKHAAILDEITNKDQKIKGEIADKLSAALTEFASDFA